MTAKKRLLNRKNRRHQSKRRPQRLKSLLLSSKKVMNIRRKLPLKKRRRVRICE